MIDPRLAAVAFCRALALLCFLWGRLVPDLTGRDWATVVAALAAAGAVFIILSTPALILLLWKIV